MSMPRLVVSGLSGGAGKTTVSLGLIRAFTRQNIQVHPFKKGPDYIDTAWLAMAAHGKASTLDPFFCDAEGLRRHFFSRSAGADLAVIEGNRGLFDGRDLAGSASTAEVARHLDAPVLLVVDITKMTRTAAALVAGCKNFPGGERIAGVILNRAGTARHAALAKRAVEELAGVPVFGVLPRLDAPPICERRAGLVTVGMDDAADKTLDGIADVICDHTDLEAILSVTRDVAVHDLDGLLEPVIFPVPSVRIGVVRDGALWQYYDENLEALRMAGAELVFVSLLDGGPWPDIDGLYLGGGDLSPHAAALAADTGRQAAVRALVEAGMPVYAEHSGYFYCGRTFTSGGVSHAMAGIFPVTAAVTEKPARLGYMEAVVTRDTPFFPANFRCKGHEYHYANLAVDGSGNAALRKKAGGGAIDVPDGLVYKSAFGSSMQIFAPAVPEWAPGFVRAAKAWRSGGGS
ncbi:Cobyrinic acid A,C-diamide synthase [uncultured delta proteobacterium]|uniref:Cobyrinic acid A,C-diamide synthase n=1 Tax=uncultured delta proteobacterium TaxID=34034 RepID=A0A212IT62_9DELT|nr:Cobyrinic acid A,C-diamide synthase [uncultured delta proteobacterium]